MFPLDEIIFLNYAIAFSRNSYCYLVKGLTALKIFQKVTVQKLILMGFIKVKLH